MLSVRAVGTLVTTRAAVIAIAVADAVAVEPRFAIFSGPDDDVLASDKFTGIASASAMGGVDFAAYEATKLGLDAGSRDLETIRVTSQLVQERRRTSES
jgi:hypothetical protein